MRLRIGKVNGFTHVYVSPYAVGGLFHQSDEKTEKLMKPWHMGTHPRELGESFPKNTNMT